MVGTPADPSGLLDVLGEPVTLPGSSVALEVVRAADGLPARLYDGSPTPHTRVWGNAEGPWPLAGDSEGAHWMWVGVEGMMVSRLEGATAAVDAMTDPLSGSLVLLGEDLLDAPGAWGTDLDVPAGRTARFVYAGQEVLPQTPYMLAGHRLYDPQLGRFLSADPLGLEGGPHRFAYADSRPTDRVDPRGLSALGWSGGVASTGVWQPPGSGGCGPRCWNVEQGDGGGTSAGSSGASPRGGRGPLTIDDEMWEDDDVCGEDLACDYGFTPDVGSGTEQDEGKGGGSGGRTRTTSGGSWSGGAGSQWGTSSKSTRFANPALRAFQQDVRAIEQMQGEMSLRKQVERDVQPHAAQEDSSAMQHAKAAIYGDFHQAASGSEVLAQTAPQVLGIAFKPLGIVTDLRDLAASGLHYWEEPNLLDGGLTLLNGGSLLADMNPFADGIAETLEGVLRLAKARQEAAAAAAMAHLHHLATNKNWVSTARGGPWSPRFQAMFERAGMTLEDEANKVLVLGHGGPHPEAYHQAVYERLATATEGLQGDAYTTALRAELDVLAVEASTAGSLLNTLLTGP